MLPVKEVVVLEAQESNFDKSVSIGKQAERFVKKYFEKKGYRVQENKAKKASELSKWDLHIWKHGKGYYVEVKNDVMSRDTGNVGFEVGQGEYQKPSCLLTTQSDYWMHIFYTKDSVGLSLCRTSALRQLILTKHLYNRSDVKLTFVEGCGDNNADLVLMRIEDFVNNFKGKIKYISYELAEREGLI